MINHRFVSGVADTSDPLLIQMQRDWNDSLVVSDGNNGEILVRNTGVADGHSFIPHVRAWAPFFIGGNKELVSMKSVNLTERVNNAVVFRIDWTRTGWAYNLITEQRTTNAATSIQPQLWNITDAEAAALGVAITLTSVDFDGVDQLQVTPVSADTGVKWYVLCGIRNNLTNETYLQGYLEGIPA